MFIDKLLSLAFGMLFLFALSCDGPSEESGKKTANTAASDSPRTLKNDPAFWDYAASSNLLQTEMGRIAIRKSKSQHIKTLATNAVYFHSGALQQLNAIATQEASIQLPDSLTGADRDIVKEFEQLEGEELSNRYRDFINSTHHSQLERYQEALVEAEDQEIRDWLLTVLSHLRQRLDELSKADTLQEASVF